jgi:DNA-directed RNA polymerase specialized sigma24 family protein
MLTKKQILSEAIQRNINRRLGLASHQAAKDSLIPVTMSDITEAVFCLPLRQRLVMLDWLEGYNCREIGERYNRSQTWAWQLLRDARAALREELK